MAEITNFDLSDLRFERAAPEAFSEKFDEIQHLRLNHYAAAWSNQRTIEEIDYFVDRLSLEKWSFPNSAVGSTAIEGQRRAQALVAIAFNDKTNDVEGFMYAAENVSSKADRLLSRLHVPSSIRTPIGDFERSKKLEHGIYYIWGSEYVHNPERPELAPILTALCLEGYNQDLAGTWYPWDEEMKLKNQLTVWGYAWDGEKPLPQIGSKGFGEGSRPTNQQRWEVPRIGIAIDRISDLPGADQALQLARGSMS